MTFITVKSLSKSYNDALILDDINFSINQGEFVSIVGPYGSGKTTLLKVLAGLVDGYTGSVVINNASPAIVKESRKVGFGFQKPTLLPWRNVIDNMLLPQDITGVNNIQKVQDLLELAGLAHTSQMHISELSGGMQQMVSILRSLVLDPDILLLDEPFSSIDEISKDDMHEKLMHIHKHTNKTTVMITHSLQEAVYLSDKVIVLSKSPATIKTIVKIDLPGRTIENKYEVEVMNYVKQLRKCLAV